MKRFSYLLSIVGFLIVMISLGNLFKDLVRWIDAFFLVIGFIAGFICILSVIQRNKEEKNTIIKSVLIPSFFLSSNYFFLDVLYTNSFMLQMSKEGYEYIDSLERLSSYLRVHLFFVFYLFVAIVMLLTLKSKEKQRELLYVSGIMVMTGSLADFMILASKKGGSIIFLIIQIAFGFLLKYFGEKDEVEKYHNMISYAEIIVLFIMLTGWFYVRTWIFDA